MALEKNLQSGIRRSAEFGSGSSNQDYKKKDKIAVAHVFGQVEANSGDGKKFQVVYDNDRRSKAMNIESSGDPTLSDSVSSESKKVRWAVAVDRLVDDAIATNKETQEKRWNKASFESKIKIVQHDILFKERDLKLAEKHGDIKEIEMIKEDLIALKQELDSLVNSSGDKKIVNEAGAMPPEAFQGGEEKLGLEDPLKSQTPAEQVVVSQESTTGLDHAAIIENDKKKLAEARAKGQNDIVSLYEKSVEYHTGELKKLEGVSVKETISDEGYKKFVDDGFVSESVITNLANISKNRERELTPREQAIFTAKASEINKMLEKVSQLQEEKPSVVEKNSEAKEGSGKKYIQDLGYSKEEILALPVEDQKKIVEEQITRNAWFGEEEVVTPAPEVLPTVEVPKNEENFVWKETNVGADGSYHHKEETVDLEELKARLANRAGKGRSVGNSKEQIENKKNFIEALEGVDSVKELVEENRKDLENLKKPETKEKAIEEYKEREAELSKMGWTLEKYSALSEREQQMVIWHNLSPEQVLEKGQVNTSESKAEGEEMTINSFLELLPSKLDESGKLNLNEKEKEFYIANKGAINSEILNRKKDTIQQLPKEAEDYIKVKINQEKHEMTVKGVSEGAKEFLGDQKLLVGLEKGYENFDKDQLIEVLKQRGLPSGGGDKQKIIERLAKDDIEKKITDFGFAENEVEDKLKDFKLSEKDMVLLSPEFFSLSKAKQEYLFSKLEQKIYLDADLASKTQNEEEIQKMGFWKKLSSSFVKGQRQVALRDKMIQTIKEGGIKDYRSDIKTLNEYLLDAPDLTYKPNERGRLVPHFEYVETTSSDKKFETPKVFFNVAASRFSEMPFEWSLKTATSSQREAYQKAYSSYTGAKESLMKVMLEEAKYKNPNINEEGEKNIQQKTLLKLAETDAQVKFGTFITQNPEMEKLSATFFEKILGANANDFTRGAMFAGAGFATKWIGRSMAMTGIGLGVAGAVGGFMAYRKKNLEYTEKELRKRYGKAGSEVQSVNKQIEDKITQIQDARINKSAGNVLDQLTNELSVLQKNRKELIVSSGIKQNINSSNVYERLEKLVSQFEKTTDEKSKQRMLETIKTRIFVTEEMMRDSRINFGSQKEQTFNQYKLSEMMSKAAITIEMNGGFGVDIEKEVVFDKFNPEKTREEKVFDRFKQFVQDNEVQSEKDKQRALAVLKGASVAMLGFGVGAGVRHLQESGFFGSAWEAISEKSAAGFNKAKEIISNFSSEDAPTTALPKIPNVAENITPVEKVMAGSRGVIGAIDDMQDKLRVKFGSNVPEQYKEFLSKDPNKLAREWGFYKPGEVNESAKIMKGEGFSIDSKGIVRFVGLNGTDEVYVPKGVTGIEVNKIESGKEFFDAGKTSGASIETPSYIETENVPVQKPEVVNEGYATTKEVKPDSTNWFEKTPPKEFGVSNVRGTWEFAKDINGRIVKVDTSRTISDDVINFRKNPRNFMVGDLKNTKLLAQTDSFAVKTLTNNRDTIERFLTEKNILNASNANLTPEETAFLKDSVSTLHKEIQIKTGGAFDGKYEEPSVFGKVEKPIASKPEKIIYFDTDNEKPKINPSVTSVSEGSDFVPAKPVKPEASPLEESVKRKPTDPLERIEKVRAERAEAERIATESNKNPKEVEVLPTSKSEIQKIKIGDLEIVKTSDDVIDQESKLFKAAVERYGTPKVSGNVSTFGERYIGFYEEELDQATAIKKLNVATNQNKNILGSMIDQIAVKNNETGVTKIIYIYEKKVK